MPIPPVVFHEVGPMPAIVDMAAMATDIHMGATVVGMRAFAGCGARSEDQAAKNKENRLDAIRYHGELRDNRLTKG
jgi:hypothetical protein